MSLTTEQRFILENISSLGNQSITDLFPPFSLDLVEPILSQAEAFAEGVWGPLSASGDTVGAKWTEAGVKMPEGYPEAYRAYVGNGWGALSAPERFGGQGLPFALQIAVLELLGVANLGFGLAPILTLGAVEALIHHGSAEQQALYLPRLVTGEWSGTMNLTEPQAGSDVGAIKALAQPAANDKWRIKGTKIFISYGDHDLAENIVHLVLARTPGAPAGTKGLSLFLVPKFHVDTSGNIGAANDISVVSIEHKLGLHASPTCVLSFGDNDGCIGELVGHLHGGMRAMFTMMNNARLNVGLQGVQVSEAATRKAASYAAGRVQGSREGISTAIIDHPDVRRMLMRMKAQTLAARSIVYYAAGLVDSASGGDPQAKARLDLIIPLAKAHSTDIGCETASLGVQVHGGMGYIEETGAARLYRDARIFPIYEGTNGIQAADLIVRKLPSDNGLTFGKLIEDMRRDAEHPHLVDLVHLCEQIGRKLISKSADEGLTGSYPFLTILATAVCGWLLQRLSAASDNECLRSVRVVSKFYLDCILPEAFGEQYSALYHFDESDLLTREELGAE